MGIKENIMDRYYDESGGYIREHNLVLYVFLRWGILGLVIIIYVCQRMISIWIHSLRKVTGYGNKLLLLSHLLFIIVFLIINMVGLYFTFFETAICFWFSIAVCLLVAQENENRGVRRPGQLANAK